MAARMIPVRNKETGQVTTVSERAFGYFADTFERLDQPAEDTPVPAPAVEPDQPKPAVRRAAATSEKE
ncbi:hypothetical protein JYK22_21415, partial [Nonomuraea sp. RK-328]|nr:hypothetical protein [Nonomuraea sp. RK-328]